jgi:exoribonuclease-2
MARRGSLVLYKDRPARVTSVGKKLGIELPEGETLQVRPKDVTLLHPGPVERLDELRPQAGDVATAWELLSGGVTSLAELAELVYGAYTPASAWAAWQLVSDGLYFRGTPEEITARLPEEVAQEQAAREARAAERRGWEAFLERVRADEATVEPADSRYLREVEELALGQRANSRVLRELGRTESAENGHALLLELGYWDHTAIPYLRRLDLDGSPPTADLPELPEETRTDLTHLPAFAIDDKGNQDPDDALSLEAGPDGGRPWGRLWVHVADVAALVRPDSAADLEARARGATLYLPEGRTDMLPPKAVETLGLGLTRISPALSFGLDLSAEGGVTGVDVVPSWVQVTRLTYDEVDSRLDEGEEPFQSLDTLAQVHQARRDERGAVHIELPEVKIRVTDGEVVIHPLPPLRSRALVREAMLMAGEAIARFALERDIPLPFTTHAPPDTDERPQDLAGMYALRRTLRRSQQSSIPAPHGGLGLEVYTRATSPLRRYLDLVVHQQLRAYLRGEDLLEAPEVLERIGAAEAVTGSVRQAERLVRKHWTLVYLMQHPGWHGEGVLVEKRDRRATVLIPELDLEIQVHVRENLPLNSPVPLALTAVDLAQLEAYFQVA